MESFIQKLAVSRNEEYKSFGDFPEYIYSSKFCPLDGSKHLLCLTNEGGYIGIQQTNSGACLLKPEARIKSFQVHGNAVFDSSWLHSPNLVVTVSGDQSVRLIDINTFDADKCLAILNFHSRSVKTVDAEPTRRVTFATGSRDGNICIWDSRVARKQAIANSENCINNAHATADPIFFQEHRIRRPRPYASYADRAYICSVTAVLYQDEYKLISAGSGDGLIKAWDSRRNYSVYSGDPIACEVLPFAGSSARRGYSSITMNKSRTRLFANCTDGVIYEYNIASYDKKPVRQYKGHLVGSYHVKCDLSPDDRFLVSGSSDNYGYIWSTNGISSEPLAKLDGHGAEVSAVAWSNFEDLTLVTCSDDYNHRIWRYDPLIDVEEEKNNYVCRAIPVTKPISRNILSLALGIDPKRFQSKPKSTLILPINSSKRKLSESENNIQRLPLSPRKENNVVQCLPKMIKLDLASGVQHKSIDENCNSSSRNTQECEPVHENMCIKLSAMKRFISPKKRCYSEPSSSSPRFVESIGSPTSNLPNYVVDGKSPSRLVEGPRKQRSNWLSDMQRVKSSVSSVERKSLVNWQNSRRKYVRQESLQKYFKKM
ncbi:hypothetical protein QYM36_014853 [Artemia franciscana]|uniref:Uncharacterized protein n=2 Tax=Artemia franciscana TaxID=6661 RepID=A0AA88KWT4_ARTSF|nr:hypothetical protein QYM36_014853 [Artemia franciscana]KAK2706961.1 hypothetical protein QYM36_014853 [Artemia franciscana]KAK2706962.1 hypothetical protein QYM36_014853 [Artemia franciscana]KAK2706963.1 hypothetical protein QYM36_014853 [Artemia franciscana]